MNVKNKIILACILIVSLSSCVNVLNSLGESAKKSGLDFMLLGLASSGGSQQVDPNAGAVIQAPTMSLTVPIGALNSATTITYADETIPEPKDSTVPLQAAYKFGPAGLQFNTGATLEICYDPKAFAEKGLSESTAEIQYMDPNTGDYISMGGDVNLATHCVSAPIYHFSVYLLTAQLLEPGVQAPNYIGGATFYPSTLIENLPATVRTRVNPRLPFASIATVVLYYRTQGNTGTYKQLILKQESMESGEYYYTGIIPALDIFAAGLEYYLEAYNTYNQSTLRPATAPLVTNTILGDIRDATTPIKYNSFPGTMSAGYSRNVNVQVKGNSSAAWFNVIAETGVFLNGAGTAARADLLRWRYSANISGPTQVEADYGNLTTPLTSFLIYPGMLDRIAILYNNVVLPNPFTVDGLDTRDLDAVGYDKDNNMMLILPTFTTTNGIGTVDNGINYGRFTAANVGVATIGQIIATLGAYNEPYNVLINPIPAVDCVFQNLVTLGQGFDSSCVFGP